MQEAQNVQLEKPALVCDTIIIRHTRTDKKFHATDGVRTQLNSRIICCHIIYSAEQIRTADFDLSNAHVKFGEG